MTDRLNPKALAYVVLSVTDFPAALALWESRFGMQKIVHRAGADPGLARMWGVADDEIVEQALLLTPGMKQGGVHLVRFRTPGPIIRENAAATDLVPKSVDIAVRDIATRHAELQAAGFKFRSSVGRFETHGVVVHEVHLPGPDGINLVFLEEEGNPLPVSTQGYGVAPQIVATSPDNKQEKRFYEEVMGLAETSYHRFAGPEIERTIGLPPGAGLDIRIFGDADYPYGRLEIVQYEAAQSRNLYPLAKAPARGMLSVTFEVTAIDAMLERARAAASTVAPVDHGAVETFYGKGRAASLWSPAGLRIDLWSPAL